VALLEALLLLAAFLAAWLTLCWALAGASGWRTLAEHYAQGERPFEGDSRRLERLSLGVVFDYGRCLVAGRGPTGLRLALLPPFVVGHPPLLIPWDDLMPPGRTRGVGPFRRVGLRFARAPGVTLWVAADLAAWLRAGSHKALDTLARSPYNQQ